MGSFVLVLLSPVIDDAPGGLARRHQPARPAAIAPDARQALMVSTLPGTPRRKPVRMHTGYAATTCLPAPYPPDPCHCSHPLEPHGRRTGAVRPGPPQPPWSTGHRVWPRRPRWRHPASSGPCAAAQRWSGPGRHPHATQGWETRPGAVSWCAAPSGVVGVGAARPAGPPAAEAVGPSHGCRARVPPATGGRASQTQSGATTPTVAGSAASPRSGPAGLPAAAAYCGATPRHGTRAAR